MAIRIRSLDQDVYLGHVFSNNVANVWNELKETYDRVDASIVFSLLQKINTFKQGGLPVSEYYHKLNSLGREFDILIKLRDCTCEAIAELIDHGKLLRLMHFLIGLDDVYQAIRSSILTRKILPEVKDAFVIMNSGNWSNGNSSSANRGNYDRFEVKSVTAVTNLNFFDFVKSETASKTPNLRPTNDEEGKPLSRDSSLHQLRSMKKIQSKVNFGTNNEVPVFQNNFENQKEEVNLRKSFRASKLLAKLNDYVLDNKVKYGLNRFANHSVLRSKNYVFVPNLNKSYDPSSYEEASKDVNWINDMNNQMLVFGYCVFVNGSHVFWKSKKQATLPKSSAKAEYREMASATCEIMWVLKILKDLGLKDLILVALHCDNKSAIQIAANLVMHEKLKHFDLDVYLVVGLIKTIQDLNVRIRAWIEDKRSNVSGKKDSIKKELSDIDRLLDGGDVSDSNLLRRSELHRNLYNINQMESKVYLQKSKIKWAIEGDENSKIFHCLINKKRSPLAIRGVFVDGIWCNNPNKVNEAFFKHFDARFKKPVNHRLKINFLFSKRLSNFQASDLERRVSRDEIRLAV
uniref:Ribonuclease H-like domain-containing protein n=1 Tax=Tanacetum cinerariifolium TaxID=118510 RepID=A0A699H6V3_TANCI|nr:ribonuclease H-like domain-containing protein [Tanacetum cinerariifolium]